MGFSELTLVSVTQIAFNAIRCKLEDVVQFDTNVAASAVRVIKPSIVTAGPVHTKISQIIPTVIVRRIALNEIAVNIIFTYLNAMIHVTEGAIANHKVTRPRQSNS